MSTDVYDQQSSFIQSHTNLSSVGKSHDACDECRARKLKCSGEPSGCRRCTEDGVTCHYSPRKQMGRPRKRRREGEKQTIDSPDLIPYSTGSNLGVQSTGSTTQDCLETSSPINGLVANPQMYPYDFTGTNGMDFDINNLNFGLDVLAPTNISQPPNQSSLSVAQDSNIIYRQFPISSPQNNTTNLQQWAPNLDQSIPITFSNNDSAHLQFRTPPTTMNSTHSQPVTPSAEPPSCTCIPTLYKILSTFSVTTTPIFPYSLSKLKSATDTGRSILHCPICPREYNKAVQNAMGLGTLVNLVISEYCRLLKQIDERSRNETKIVFRMGETLTPETRHLHTGTPDCPMGISVDLSGLEWRTLARKTVRKEVLGEGFGDECLQGLLQGMRERQVRWHESFPTEKLQHVRGGAHKEGDKCICTGLLYIDQLQKWLEGLGL